MTTIALDWLHIAALLGAIQGVFLALVLDKAFGTWAFGTWGPAW